MRAHTPGTWRANAQCDGDSIHSGALDPAQIIQWLHGELGKQEVFLLLSVLELMDACE